LNVDNAFRVITVNLMASWEILSFSMILPFTSAWLVQRYGIYISYLGGGIFCPT
jgi:hypothetical protein